MVSRPSDVITILNKAFDFFNKELFEGELPECLVHLHRKNQASGFYWHEAITNRNNQRVSEIAISPEGLSRHDIQILGTLVHEMVHLWQMVYGKDKPDLDNMEHNGEWAKKMKRIGLFPSTTGRPGGKETGINCSHYIVIGGDYAEAYKKWEKLGFKIEWFSDPIKIPKKKKPSTQKTYVCSSCKITARAKTNTKLTCTTCKKVMTLK